MGNICKLDEKKSACHNTVTKYSNLVVYLILVMI